MIYTSGTTGHPKGVRRAPMNSEQVRKNAALLRDIYGIEEGMRAFVCGPLYHASPGAFARQAFQHAELTVLQHSFDPEDLLRTIAEHRITRLQRKTPSAGSTDGVEQVGSNHDAYARRG